MKRDELRGRVEKARRVGVLGMCRRSEVSERARVVVAKE